MMNKEDQIVIYQTASGQVALEVNLREETVWLTQKQMTILFERERSVITKHIRNIFTEGELEQNQVCANIAHTAADGKTYQVEHYNLDVIISVGYRVKSKRGTQFRIWATNVLRQYLVEGYALNQQRLTEQAKHLKDLQEAVRLVSDVVEREVLSPAETQGILAVLDRYSHALTVLDEYDHQTLQISDTRTSGQVAIGYEEAIEQIRLWRQKEKAGALFGNEKDDSFKSSLAVIYQTFGGDELYPSIEEKAAHLLYFVVKNHSFTDGNKRIAAALFAWFLARNGYLYHPGGQKRIADNALVALTLMIAQSKPEEKDLIVKVVVNLINHKN
jgi:prophage maintenance system killer protein